MRGVPFLFVVFKGLLIKGKIVSLPKMIKYIRLFINNKI